MTVPRAMAQLTRANQLEVIDANTVNWPATSPKIGTKTAPRGIILTAASKEAERQPRNHIRRRQLVGSRGADLFA